MKRVTFCALLFALASSIVSASIAFAAKPAATPEGRWGAIAFGAPDLAAGWAVDYLNADEAREAALQQCPSCTRTITFVRSCAAVAQSSSGAIGFSRTRFRGRAIARALGLCGRDAGDCRLVAVACTTH
jgi:hypothetical protein